MIVRTRDGFIGQINGPVTLIYLDPGETLEVEPLHGRAVVVLYPEDAPIDPVHP